MERAGSGRSGGGWISNERVITMYQHLDDPSPPSADPGRYRAVVARADALRARRRHRRTSGVLVALLCSALVAVGWLAIGDVAPGNGTRVTAFAFNERSGRLPAGTVVPAAALAGVVFVDGRDGFGLADHRSRPVLAATTDGGTTWRLVGGHLPSALSGSPGSTEVEFTSTRVGYLWPAPAVQASDASLWTTHDGGVRWHRAPIGRTVVDASAIGTDVWALTESCAAGGPCHLQLEVSTDAGRSWRSSPVAPPVPAWAPGAHPAVELARVTPTTAYVYADVAGRPYLVFTADAGTTWSMRPVPCAAPLDAGAELALSGTDDLWLVCGGPAAGGTQAKALYRSHTAGATWSLAARTPGPGGGAGPSPGAGTLPLDGYVAPYSLGHRNLAVLSSHEAWLFPTGGAVSATTDGGSTWSPVASLAGAAFGSGAPGDVTFISRNVGWVVELGVGLWHTSDAVTWRPVGT